MLQLLNTDFIKNRMIQALTALGLIFDILSSKSITHVSILFGLPYALSIVLHGLMRPKKVKFKGRVSEQYRPKP